MKKNILIKCKGAGTLAYSLLTPLQGQLKTITKENLQKLKNEIIVDGFSFPIAVWEDITENKLYILDGHQRYSALKSLKDDGYSIPEIPIVWVEADSYEEAKHKLLAAASQYGKTTEDGLRDFLSGIEFDIQDLKDNFDLDINFDNLQVSLTAPEITVTAPEEWKKVVEVEAHSREIKAEKTVYKYGDTWICGIHTVIYSKFTSLDRILQIANTLGENLVIGGQDGLTEADNNNKVCVIVNSDIDQVLSIIKKWEDRTKSKAEKRTETILRQKNK